MGLMRLGPGEGGGRPYSSPSTARLWGHRGGRGGLMEGEIRKLKLKHQDKHRLCGAGK